MKNIARTLPAAALLAAVVAVSASTGAVAAAMITGKDIKNGTVTSVDLKDKSVTGKDVKDGALTAADLSSATVSALKGANGTNGTNGAPGAPGAPGISGLEIVVSTTPIPAGVTNVAIVACPAGKKMLGMTADWTANSEPTAARINPNLTSGTAYGMNDTGVTQTLRGSGTCAFVS